MAVAHIPAMAMDKSETLENLILRQKMPIVAQSILQCDKIAEE